MSVPKSIVRWRRQVIFRSVVSHIARATGRTVCSGPFSGVRYPERVRVGNALPSKFLGVYECELHGFLTEIKGMPVRLVVDAGAAEGYYVAGFAQMFPSARLVSFEVGPEECAALQSLADANGFSERLEMRGWCTADQLRSATESGRDELTLLLMDIEGGEYEILCRENLSAPDRTIVIAELHDTPGCGRNQKLAGAFRETHDVLLIPSRERRWSDLPPLFPRLLKKWVLHASSDERLGQQEWLCMVPKANGR